MNERLLTSLNLSNMNLYEHSYYNRKAVPESDFTGNSLNSNLYVYFTYIILYIYYINTAR